MIYSESPGSGDQVKEHQRLARKENILIEHKVETIQIDIDGETSEVTETETEEDGETTTDAYDTIADEDSKDESSESEDDKSEKESYYKTLAGHSADYSYAYKDCLSPAALIKMENESVVSEVSETVYETLGNVPHIEADLSTMSDSMSEREDFFFSISKGRRNFLKLHKYVGWELNSVAEDEENTQAPEPVSHEISIKPVTHINTSAEHSRLLPLLLKEEVSYYSFYC